MIVYSISISSESYSAFKIIYIAMTWTDSIKEFDPVGQAEKVIP